MKRILLIMATILLLNEPAPAQVEVQSQLAANALQGQLEARGLGSLGGQMAGAMAGAQMAQAQQAMMNTNMLLQQQLLQNANVAAQVGMSASRLGGPLSLNNHAPQPMTLQQYGGLQVFKQP